MLFRSASSLGGGGGGGYSGGNGGGNIVSNAYAGGDGGQMFTAAGAASVDTTATNAGTGYVTIAPQFPVASALAPRTTYATSQTSLIWDLTMSASVTGITTSSFTAGGTSSGWTVASVTGSGATYVVTLTNSGSPAPEGTVFPTLLANTATDAASRTGPGVNTAGSPSTVDRTVPTASAITLSTISRTAATYSVTFSEPVTGLTTSDFAASGGSTGWTVSSVTGSGAGPYTVTLANATSGGAPAGTHILTLAANAVADAGGLIGPASSQASTTTLGTPTNTVAPTISAAPVGLIALTCGNGTWTAYPSVTGYTYQWKTSADAGATWANATGTGNATVSYTPALADTWKLLRCDVTATNAYGSTAAPSASQPVQPADLLFSTDYLSSKIGTHSVSATGQLSRIAATNTAYYTRGLALTPDQRFLYASVESGSGLIQQFAVTENGTLTALTPDISAAAYDVAVTPDGRFAYSANYATSGTVGQYAIGRDGRLSPLATPTIAAGNGTAQLAITSDGKFLYAVNWVSGDVSSYSIGGNGQLTSLGAVASVGATPRGMTLVERGSKRFLYVAGYGTNKLYGFEIDGAGGLTALTGMPSPTAPNLLSASPDGQYLYVGLWTSAAVAQYAINGTTGALTALTPATVATGTQPYEPFVHPSGQWAYVGSGSTTYQYGVSSGALAALSPATESTATAQAYRFRAFRPVLAVSDLTPAATRISGASTTFSLSFTRPVTGLAAGDFSLSGTSTGYAVTGVSGSGAGPYTVTVSAAGARTDGTLILKLATSSVNDLLGNAGPTVDFPMLTAPTVTVDTVAPTIISSTATSVSRTAATYSVTFSEPMTTLTAAMLSNGGSSTGWTFSSITGSGAGPYTVTLANATSGGAPAGTLIPTFSAGATDVAGNPIDASGRATATTTLGLPINTAVPTTSGTVALGQVLTCGQGTWTSVPAITSTAYQWQWSTDGATGWTNAAGTGNATASYTVAPADVGRYLRCAVTPTNPYGTATANSAATTDVPAVPLLLSTAYGSNAVYVFTIAPDDQIGRAHV